MDLLRRSLTPLSSSVQKSKIEMSVRLPLVCPEIPVTNRLVYKTVSCKAVADLESANLLKGFAFVDKAFTQ